MSIQPDGTPEGPAHNDVPPAGSPPDGELSRVEPELPRWAGKMTSPTGMSESRLAAFIGPRWESTYRAKFARFIVDPAFTPTWNWAAAFGSPFWFLYRKLYLAFGAFTVVPFIALSLLSHGTATLTLQTADTPEAQQLAMTFAAISLSSVIAAGGTGNWLLFRRARAETAKSVAGQMPEDITIARLQRVGGVNPMLTLLFFLIVSVMNIFGVLGARG